MLLSTWDLKGLVKVNKLIGEIFTKIDKNVKILEDKCSKLTNVLIFSKNAPNKLNL